MQTRADSAPTIEAVSLSQDAASLAEALGGSFQRYGFAIVADHGIPAGLVAKSEQAARQFFGLPQEVKDAYHRPGTAGARGYTPFGIETAKGAASHDLKEFWHIGRELTAGHPYCRYMPANLWPSEVEGFRETFLELFAAFEQAGARLLGAIARWLEIDPAYFDAATRDGNSVLRLLHYPPVPPDAPGVRAGAHEDINAITLLLGAEEAGLELLDRDGRWLAVTPNEGELVVNIGDMLQRLTNDVLPSTTHRVVNPPPERRGKARYSMPFFLHFAPDFLIETLPGCVSDGRPDRYSEPITADDFLQQRLKEIKLA